MPLAYAKLEVATDANYTAAQRQPKMGNQTDSLLVGSATAARVDDGLSDQTKDGTEANTTSHNATDNKPACDHSKLTSSPPAPTVGNPALEKAAKQMVHVTGIIRKIEKDILGFIAEPELAKKLGLAELEALVESLRHQVQRGEAMLQNGEAGIPGMVTIPDSPTTLVNTIGQLSELITSIAKSSASHPNDPTFYFDCEGKNLGRHGTITLLAIYIPDALRVFIVDLQELGNTALQTEQKGETLESIFESAVILKGVFDCRGDSDALFAHHGVKLDGIVDVQLMEAATRRNSKRLFGLDACLKSRLKLPAKTQFFESKDRVKEMLRADTGSCFAERPIPDLLLQYAAQDVLVLPVLYEHFLKHESYRGEWPSRVMQETEKRLQLSRSCDYDPSNIDMRRGPEEWVRMSRAVEK